MEIQVCSFGIRLTLILFLSVYKSYLELELSLIPDVLADLDLLFTNNLALITCSAANILGPPASLLALLPFACA